MDIRYCIDKCAETTKSKGFDTSQHLTQIVLIASECAEAMELIGSSLNDATEGIAERFTALMQDFETLRKEARDYRDESKVVGSQDKYLEELADIAIRLFSYVGGNGLAVPFEVALVRKMRKNAERPHLHGKGF